MDENLVEYQQMLKAADAQMAKEIEDMTNGKYVKIIYHFELSQTRFYYALNNQDYLFQGVLQKRIKVK